MIPKTETTFLVIFYERLLNKTRLENFKTHRLPGKLVKFTCALKQNNKHLFKVVTITVIHRQNKICE